MNWDDISKKLQAPFPPGDIHWRVGQAGEYNGKTWVKILAYIANRDVQNRLDSVVGCQNWRNEYREGSSGGTICGIGIWDDEKKEWIVKYDGAENTDIEAVKGGLSDAMKRAAVQWGIGRYLYDLGEAYADVLEGNVKGEHRSRVKIGGKDTTVNWNVPAKVKQLLSAGIEPQKPQQPQKHAPAEPPKQEAKPASKKPKATAPEKPGSNASSKSGEPGSPKLTGTDRLMDMVKFMGELGAYNKAWPKQKNIDAYDFILRKCNGSVDANPTWAEIKADEAIDLELVKSSINSWITANHMERHQVFATLDELEKGVPA